MEPGTEQNTGYESLSLEQKIQASRKAKKGDTWIQLNGTKKVTVWNNSPEGIKLVHESKRRSTKKHHYFCQEYRPCPQDTQPVKRPVKKVLGIIGSIPPEETNGTENLVEVPYQDLDYQDQCTVAEKAPAGSIWINNKTGRRTTVTKNTWRGIHLQHESGRTSEKQHHYFAGDYHPENPAILCLE